MARAKTSPHAQPMPPGVGCGIYQKARVSIARQTSDPQARDEHDQPIHAAQHAYLVHRDTFC